MQRFRSMLLFLVLAVILCCPQVYAAQLTAKPATERFQIDGDLSKPVWQEAEWILIPHTNILNKEYADFYSSNKEASMLVSVLHDRNYIYVGVKAVMEKLAYFPLTTIEVWLGNLQIYLGVNTLGEDVFQTVVKDDEKTDATPLQRARYAMVKEKDLDPENRFGLAGVPGYSVEIAVAKVDLSKRIPFALTDGSVIPFAAGYRMPIPGAELNDGLIYYPETYVYNDVTTFAELTLGN